MHINTDPERIEEILTRSIDTVYPAKEALRKKLSEGTQLRIYMGIDPTADYIHIGHSTNYIILRRLHELGHKIIVLVGDFTAMIGDPSDKTSMRVQLTKEEVEENLKSFKAQIAKILDLDSTENPIEFRFNSDWLSSLTFADATELASNFTVQQMLERDAFQKRIAAKKPLFIHEFFYPFMQGYDSVALDADIEIGGTDQTFNMLAGRTLVARLKQKEKFVITTTLLTNPETGEKLMSKSLGTGVSLKANPQDMFGKVMALADAGIMQCFIDCTYLPQTQIQALQKELSEGKNPRDIKLRLAHEIVTMYHSKKEADEAQEAWINQFSKGALPQSLPDLLVDVTWADWESLLAEGRLAASKSGARRLLQQGAVKLQQQKLTPDTPYRFAENDILQVGKRVAVRLKKT